MVHQCTKLHGWRTNHKQVIDTNTIYKFYLPDAVVVVVYNLYILILMMGCMCVQSFIILGISSTYS